MTTSQENSDHVLPDTRRTDNASELLRRQVGIRRRDAMITIRPIEPADRDAEQEFVKGLSPGSRYQRFLSHIKELSPALLDQFTEVRYPDSMALVATVTNGNREKQIGVARYAREFATNTADVAIVVADEWHGQGLGNELMSRILTIAKSACIEQAQSLVLRDNSAMLRLAKRLGFALCDYPDDPVLLRISKQLHA